MGILVSNLYWVRMVDLLDPALSSPRLMGSRSTPAINRIDIPLFQSIITRIVEVKID
jgi:hypothetical protein